MKSFKKMSLLLVLAGLLLGVSPVYAVNLTLDPSATTVAPGGTVDLRIKVSDATGLCGAAVTVKYDANVLDVVTNTGTVITGEITNTVQDITSDVFAMVSDNRTPPGTPAQAYPRVGNVAAGKLMLSGAFVKSDTGAGAYTGEKILFSVKFKVKTSVAKGTKTNITLEQSELLNPSAGWYTDTNSNGTYDAGTDTAAKVDPLIGVPDDWKSKPTVAEQFTKIPTTFPSGPTEITVGDAYQLGDGSGDGTVDATDALLALQAFVGIVDPSQLKGSCDVNKDGTVDATDALIILQYFVGIITSF